MAELTQNLILNDVTNGMNTAGVDEPTTSVRDTFGQSVECEFSSSSLSNKATTEAAELNSRMIIDKGY